MTSQVTQDDKAIRILCTGGLSGYLASFIFEAIGKHNIQQYTKIQYLPTSRNLDLGDTSESGPTTFRFRTPEEVTNASKTLLELEPDVIVHAAAMAALPKCEQNPNEAMEANCPSGLLDAIDLAEQDSDSSWSLRRLIYLSTDQVYQGNADSSGRVVVPSPSGFTCNFLERNTKEETLWPPILPNELPPPVNMYGRSKLAFESLLMERRSKNKGDCVILRLSNMIGPVSPLTGDGRFLQWLDIALSVSPSAEKISLFVDEYRNFVYVRDVARAVLNVSLSMSQNLAPVYNVGGQINLSRYDFGKLVCHVKGFEFKDSNVGEKKRADIADAAYESPLNIGMDSSALKRDFIDFEFTPMEVALKESLL